MRHLLFKLFNLLTIGLVAWLVTGCYQDNGERTPVPQWPTAYDCSKSQVYTVIYTNRTDFTQQLYRYGLSSPFATLPAGGSTLLHNVRNDIVGTTVREAPVVGRTSKSQFIFHSGLPCDTTRVEIIENPQCRTSNFTSLEVFNQAQVSFRVQVRNTIVNIDSWQKQIIPASAGRDSLLATQTSGIVGNNAPAQVYVPYNSEACAFTKVIIPPLKSCQINNRSIIKINNRSQNQYSITTAEGTKQTVWGGYNANIEAPSGSATLTVKQESGFLLGIPKVEFSQAYVGAACATAAEITIKQECEALNFAMLRLTNSSTDNYRVQKDGAVIAEIAGNSTSQIPTISGTYQLKATKTNSTGPRVEIDRTITITSCNDVTFAFP